MSPRLIRLYREERKAGTWAEGTHAIDALRNARLRARWNALEAAGYVKIVAYPDDNYRPDTEDKGDVEAYERDGAWGTVGFYRIEPAETDFEHENGPGWVTADSVWGHVGYRNVIDPHENHCVYDIMSETIDQFKAAWKEHVRGACPACHGTGRK